MSSKQDMHDNNKMEISWKLTTLKPWMVFLICLLILVSIVISKHNQSLNASAIVPIDSQLKNNKQNGQVQENKTRIMDKLASTPSIWPASGAVTSGFGWRNAPLESGSELHEGIDIASELGTPVVATADGEVVKTGLAGGYGNIVQINHGNGIETIYGHNSQIAVKVGQSVRKGQVISYAGSTGKSTGPHVHYEVRVNGSAVDPIKFLVLY